ncbi:anti-sigma factor [Rhizobium sp. BK251]|uniref:anti-sigma factor family protein n=1 Tax=Rhizobium sp. BK251 TaxID=2512125 RepID=UPI00104353D6|nr:anti-sigma factor [Rhizobium sp. BK251]TCL75988.1 anti-sigma factor RsiW [Rhizobium sp. BK251]
MSVKPITEDDLQAFVDGALDDARDTEVSAYLEAHPDVAARVASYRSQRFDLRAALGPVFEEPVPSRLTLTHMVGAPERRRPFFSWRMAAAAAVLLVVGGSSGWMLHGLSQPRGEGVVALAREASESYSTYASDTMRPVELRADNAAELVAWAAESMGRKPVLPDLSGAGYRLMGGRVVSTPHGAGLMLMFDNDRGTRLVMLTRPMVVDQDKAMTPHSQGDLDAWSWAADGMGYSLVGAVPADTLHPLADDIRRQVDGAA